MENNLLKVIFFIVLANMFLGGVNAQEDKNGFVKKIEDRLNVLSDSLVPQLNDMAEFTVVEASMQELLRGIAEVHHLNVSIATDIDVSITNNFTHVSVKDLILFLCKKYEMDIDFTNNIFSFKNRVKPVVKEKWERKIPDVQYDIKKQLLSLNLHSDSLSLVIEELIKKTKRNLVVNPEVKNYKLDGYIKDMPYLKAVEMMAMSNGLQLDTTNLPDYLIVEKKGANNNSDSDNKGSKNRQKVNDKGESDNLVVRMDGDSLLSVYANSVQITDIIKLAADIAGKDFLFLTKPEGSKNIKFSGVTFNELMTNLFLGGEESYTIQHGIYVIGKRGDEGFRQSHLFKFQYRTIWGIEKIIPKTLSDNVQISAFDELNAFVISGSNSKVNALEYFLKELDQPVPNIMIDVMVINVTKSSSKEVGLSAVVGDSVSTTKGTVYPYVDMTLSSNSLNSLLTKLEHATSINLGKLTPNFYLSLKALETNGNVKIESTPRLSTLNGHEATLTIGESQYYEESTSNVTSGTSVVVTTSSEYSEVESNMTIKITPMVSGDENVTLDIEAEFSDFVDAVVDGAPPGNSTRKFVSQIRVLNEEAILLGGLEETSKEESHSGVPILSRIPVLKWIFSSNSKSNSEGKLLVLIKPKIIY